MSIQKKTLFASLLFIFTSAFYAHPLKYAPAASFADGKTLVLYDASSGQLPDSSVMAFTDFPPGSASLTYADSATVLDTTIAGTDTFAGWVSNPTTTPGFPILDSATGIQVNFTMQVETETHANKNRAGFSLIVLDQNAQGIEISFWEDQIWVQSDAQTGGLFRHGEGSAFVATNMTEYQLAIGGDTYTLLANSAPLLNGPVRDYSSFSGFPDPYETPNLLFIGDDSTSSQARVKLKFVSISGREPVIPTIGVTSTGTVIPVDTPLPGATSTPFPTPAPARPVAELCPSGWLFGAVIISNVVIRKIIRRRNKHL
ncbi:MAG TPA: hypothetical protein VK909_21200 [Anaerolineales bacterium]|nr:hypothetical protein [Anaerolineales bacterium]